MCSCGENGSPVTYGSISPIWTERLGFISGGAIREPLQTYDAGLYAIYLLEQAQRQGIGTDLLKELAESLLSKGFTSMIVWVLEKNPSRHFYVRSGAQIVTTKEIQIGCDAI